MLKKIIAEQKSAVFQEYQIQNQCIDPENFSDHKPSILSFHFYYNIQTNASKSMKKQTNKKPIEKKIEKKHTQTHTHTNFKKVHDDVIWEKKQKTIFWRIIQLLLLIMAQKNDNAAAAISYRSEFFTSRIPIRIPEIQKEEKRMEIYLLLKKKLKI